ncbi:MAG: hypothetical protein ACWA40_03595 [Planktomarina sp.]
MRNIFMGLALCAVMAGCGAIKSSKLNPGNWGNGQTDQAQTIKPLTPDMTEAPAFVDTRALIDRLQTVEVSNVTGGILIRAVGQASEGRAYGAALVPAGLQGGALTFAFRSKVTAGTAVPVTVALFVPEKDLRGIRSIKIQGANRSVVKRY